MQYKEGGLAAWQEWVKNNGDFYGSGIVRYVRRWAERMEERMAAGETLPGCWKEASHEADTEGITGFMYGAAVSVIKTVWEHGDELACLHNLDIQIRDEGERANERGTVLNPALLNMAIADES